MKKLLLIFLFLSFCAIASAQVPVAELVSTNPATCTPRGAYSPWIINTVSAPGAYYCSAPNTWTPIPSTGNGTVSSGLQNQVAIYNSNGTTVSGLTTANNGVLVTSSGGVPSISSTLPTAVQNNITNLGTIASIGAALGVPFGGTGLASLTAGRIPYGNGSSALNNSANLTYSGGQVKIDGSGTITVPYNSGVTIPTWVGTVFPSESYGGSTSFTNDQTFISGTGTVNNSTNVTINSGHSFNSGDVGLTFAIYTTSLFNAPFCNSTIASVTDSTHIVITPSCALNLSAQPWALLSPLSNIYSVVVGNGASSATTGATVVGTGASASSSTYFFNNGGQMTIHGQYGGPPVIIGTLASGIGVAVGPYAQATNIEAVAIGPASRATCLACFSLGDRAEATGNSDVVIGDALSATGNPNIHIGGGGTAAQNASIILGQCNAVGNPPGTGPCDFADHQMLVGGAPNGSTAGFSITDLWFGNGDGVDNRTWSNTTPVAFMLHSTQGQGSNVSGGNIVVRPGESTGNAIPSIFSIQTTSIGSSSSSLQTPVDSEIVGPTKILTNNSAVAIVNVTDASNTSAAGTIDYTITVSDGTNLQYEKGQISYGVTNKAGAFSGNTVTKFGNQQNTTSGTLTVTFAISGANPAVITCNANSSLTPSAGFPLIKYKITNGAGQAIAIQ